MTPPADIRWDDVVQRVAAWRVARTACADHIRDCDYCADGGVMCEAGREKWRLADRLENSLPYNAITRSWPLPAPEPTLAITLVTEEPARPVSKRALALAFGLGVALLSIYPIYQWLWR